MPKIKIIHIICSLGYGGAERFLVDLIKFSDHEKFEIKVVTAVRGGPLVQELEKMGIPVQVFEKKTKLGLGVLWKIYRYLRKEKPDIVHTHLFAGDAWGKTAAILARVPIIISTEQNLWWDEGWLKKLCKWILSHWTDKVAAISEAVKNYLIKTEHISKSKIVVIPNGVDTEKFFVSEPQFFVNPIPVVGTIGRLEKQKGHQYLLETLSLLKERQWEAWLIGEGSLQGKLEKQAKQQGIKERVQFLSPTGDILPLLQKMDIFVLPSLWEGLGIVLLEAALAGKPIIASAVDGIKEILENKKTALLVPPASPASLAKAIEWLLEHRQEAQQMALTAQRAVKEKFDIRIIAQDYQKLYLQLM